jgi:hypothetical protein
MTTTPQPTDIARGTDPATSHLAADHMVESGKRQSIADAVADALRHAPGSTYGQLADLLPGLDRAQVWRRCSDLHAAGRAFPDGEAVYEGSGRAQRRWWPTGHHEAPAGAVREPRGPDGLGGLIATLATLSPAPGDLLVVEVARDHLSASEARAATEQIAPLVPDVRVLVVARGTGVALHDGRRPAQIPMI